MLTLLHSFNSLVCTNTYMYCRQKIRDPPQRNAENACVNGIWQLDLMQKSKTENLQLMSWKYRPPRIIWPNLDNDSLLFSLTLSLWKWRWTFWPLRLVDDDDELSTLLLLLLLLLLSLLLGGMKLFVSSKKWRIE